MGAVIQNGKYVGGLDAALVAKIGTATLNTSADDLSGAINEHEADITEIRSTLTNLVKSTTVEGTTTASGALGIPTALLTKPLIDIHYLKDSGFIGLVYRRDYYYFTCLQSSLSPYANTNDIKVKVWYLDV